MSDCCTSEKPLQKFFCPACHNPVKQVSIKTLQHHLQYPDYLDLSEESAYCYCPDLNCEIAYFSAQNQITKQQLHSWPLIKQDLLCYCFAILRREYQDALKKGQGETVKKFVIKQTKAGNCACEVKNPGGHCCLSEFKKIDQSIS